MHEGPQPNPVRFISGAERRHFHELDSLRGLAATAVVFHHAVILTILGNAFWHENLSPSRWWEWAAFRSPMVLVQQGLSAVYLFFVLSGFVLALPWLDGRGQIYRTFIIRRICRIYLPYLTAILASVILLAILGHPAIPALSPWYAAIWNGPLNARTLADVLVVDTHNAFLDFPVWSIAWELRISIVFPLMLVPLAFMGRGGLLFSLMAAGVAAFAFRLAGPAGAELGRQAFAYAALFIFGAMLASCRDQVRRFKPASAGVTSAALVAGVMLLCPIWSPRPIYAFFPLGVGSVLVIAAALRAGWFSRLLSRAAPRWLGKISFSLYLIHVPILSATLAAGYGRLPIYVSIPLGVCISFLMAPIFYRFVEAPSQQLGRQLTSGWGSKVPARTPDRSADAEAAIADHAMP